MYRIENYSFQTAWEELQRTPLERHLTARLWRQCLSINSEFCDAVVKSGLLTWEQMLHAACRYCLGATRQRGVIFWQIDREGCVHDGKVMYYREDCHRDKARHPTWVSTLLGRRYRWADAERMTTSHCWFGCHLLENRTPWTPSDSPCLGGEEGGEEAVGVAVVESEKTAFVMSELFPQRLWLATGGLGNVQTDQFRRLRGRRVTLFPDTDTDGTTFRQWYEAAQRAMEQPFWEGSPPIRVSPLLELHATPEQREQKIDLLDFLAPSVRQGMEAPNAPDGGSKRGE